jgi:transcriptional regulator GlxA family with amidase domain
MTIAWVLAEFTTGRLERLVVVVVAKDEEEESPATRPSVSALSEARERNTTVVSIEGHHSALSS